MYKLQKEAVRGWRSGGGFDKCPSAVSAICPDCGETVTFSITPEAGLTKQKQDHLQGVSMRGTCPACRFIARFIQVGKPQGAGYGLFIHPDPKLVRRPLPELDEDGVFSGRIRKAYVEAISAYNAKQWIPAAIMAGRAVEGTTKSLLPKDKRKLNLARQLRELPDDIEFEKTISDLTDGIRKGRNIAAHFDNEIDINEPVAAMLLDLLDSVVEYLFILPERIARLDDQLDEGRRSESGSGSDSSNGT